MISPADHKHIQRRSCCLHGLVDPIYRPATASTAIDEDRARIVEVQIAAKILDFGHCCRFELRPDGHRNPLYFRAIDSQVCQRPPCLVANHEVPVHKWRRPAAPEGREWIRKEGADGNVQALLFNETRHEVVQHRMNRKQSLRMFPLEKPLEETPHTAI